MRKLEVTLNNGQVFPFDVLDDVDFSFHYGRTQSFINLRATKGEIYQDEMKDYASVINAALRQDSSYNIDSIKLSKDGQIIFFDKELKIPSAEYRINSATRSGTNIITTIEELSFLIM